MKEADMRDLMAAHPGEFFNGKLTLVGTEVLLEGKRVDIIFEDRHGRGIIVELQRGVLSREKSGQIAEYWGLMKTNNPGQFVELILVANNIPPERRLFLESIGIECREVPIQRFREVGEKYGKGLADEQPQPGALATKPVGDAGADAFVPEAAPFRGTYRPDALKQLNRAFAKACHKIRDIGTGKNTNGTDHLLLTDLAITCAQEVTRLTAAGVLSAEKIRNIDYVRTLAGLDREQLNALRKQERASAALNLPRDLAEHFNRVVHRIRGIEDSNNDVRCTKLRDRSLEHFVSETFNRLRASVPFLRI